MSTFRHIDGIWVTSVTAAQSAWQCALRAGLLEIAAAQRSLDGRNDKMDLIYNYLSGPEFRHRVGGIVEAYVTLREELETEKRATLRMWAKRDKQLDRAIANTSGMYGDLQGIIGTSLPAIESLDRRLLNAPTSSVDNDASPSPDSSPSP